MTLKLKPFKQTANINGFTTDLILRKFTNVILMPIVEVWHTDTSGNEIKYIYCVAFMNVLNVLYSVPKFNGYYNESILVKRTICAQPVPNEIAI